jgi:murein DD-endopeptidase MepM/ murein hydrolase activator NlpD
MAPARLRLVPALLLTLLGVAAAAALINPPTTKAAPLIPDSASGEGSEDDTWPAPLPAPPRPERPAVIPREVAVGDLALGHEPPATGDAVSMLTQSLHYPLAVGALEQDPWGWRFSSARGAWRMHTGVDLIAPEGTAVLAVQTGRVQRVADIAGYGLTVLVDHGGGWSSLYAHLLEASVSPGESVRAGQPLGLVGQSGNASGPHLHLEVRQRQPQGLVAVDPTPLLPAPPPGGAIAGDIRP